MEQPLGNYLRTHRRYAALTQQELAWAIGYPSVATISNHERLTALPPLMTAIAYQAVFQVPVSDIFAGVTVAMEQLVERRLNEFEARLRGESGRGANALLIERKLEWLEERRRGLSVITRIEDGNRKDQEPSS